MKEDSDDIEGSRGSVVNVALGGARSAGFWPFCFGASTPFWGFRKCHCQGSLSFTWAMLARYSISTALVQQGSNFRNSLLWNNPSRRFEIRL
jgi:hypothetical protein